MEPASLEKPEPTTTNKEVSQKKKKVLKDISSEIVLNFKFDDFDPNNQKYQPTFYKYHNQINFESISIFDQNRFRFILSNSVQSSNYIISDKGNYTSLDWSSIVFVIYYYVGLYQCPICLESEMVCPQITECGHVFCWACLVNFSNYITTATNKNKLPQCPICSKKLDLTHYEGKFCEIVQCYDYSVKEKNEITFDLVMRNKKSTTLYNINSDPDLSYLKKKGMKDMMGIPSETDSCFSFSRVFYSSANHILERLIKYKEILELELKEEMEFYADERRIASLNECIKVIVIKIANAEKEAQMNKDIDKVDNDKAIESETIVNYSKYFLFYQENNGDIYYLHPLLYQMIQMEYSSEEQYPSQISGVILDIEMHQVTYSFKKNYPYLSHLRIGSIIFFVEIEIKHLVSFKTFKQFGHELRKRAKVRMMLSKEEKSYEKYIKTKMIQDSHSNQMTTQVLPAKGIKENENKNEAIDSIKETHYILEEDEDNIKEEKEARDNNAQSEPKKVNKLYELLHKEELLAKQREEEDNKKKFQYKEEDFPTLSADLYLSKAVMNKKVGGGGGGGRKNKKKKFTEMAPDLLIQIESNLTLEEIDKENTAKQKKAKPNKGINNDNKSHKK